MSFNATFGISANQTDLNQKQGQTAGQFAASFVTAIAIFAVQVLVFLLIKDRFARIYQPRTYLVPERERTTPTLPGWWKWIKPVLKTSNSEFVQRCGLDAYFFLRYLRTLLKIFVPAALVILPILIPLNMVHGRGADWAVGKNINDTNVTGLDQLAWGNVSNLKTHRYWAHWMLAFLLVVYICYVSFDELRNYIRMRQAYMTSPQHRLRASATTVLVSAIPQKWCSVEALDGLYDVFPGGVRNIWINRNFDELNEKVKTRDKLALKLEAVETDLIRKCFKKNEKDIEKAEKGAGKTLTKDEKKRRSDFLDGQARQQAQGQGLTTGNPHQARTVEETTGGNDRYSSSEDEEVDGGELEKKRTAIPIPVIGEGIHAVTQGIGQVGRGILGGIRGINRGLNDTIDTTNGFVPIDEEHARGRASSDSQPQDHHVHHKPAHHHQSSRDEPNPAPRRAGAHDASARGANNLQGANGHQRPAQRETHNPQQSPLSQTSTMQDEKARQQSPIGRMDQIKRSLGLVSEKRDPVDYPPAFDREFVHDQEDAVWKRYLTEKDRDTMRLPIFGWQWMISLPFVGEKVDTIRYCRREVARLNVEIEADQANPERFPLMNSAFVQFNHQVAAHMACQSLSHHLPKQMAPRMVEIDPNDVIWDNMSIPWWQSYIRTAGVVTVVVGMIILWAVPVAFTSGLSQLNTVAQTYHWLAWVMKIPAWFRSVLQGVLPAALLGLLLFLLPIILRALIKLQGTQSGMLIELSVQRYYFFFLFVQLFLVVTVASSAIQFIASFTSASGLASIPDLLGRAIPKASNYFISYMLLQALSVSAGALVQVGSLVGWFILAPLFDSTARAKFQRQTSLSDIQWGTFFPVYTNLACIGLIYSVISPLILIFNIITFSLFWFVYRYNTLYVTRFTRDTGGLLYPNAINYTFVGVYMMEIALIGMFFLVRDPKDNVVCSGQAIGMIVILILTIGYQILLNNAFSPLFRYLPITLEDDAVRRDEEFARAMQVKHGLIDGEMDGEDLEDQLEEHERREREDDENAHEYELEQIKTNKSRQLRKEQSHTLPELEPYEVQNPEVAMNLDEDSKGVRFMKKAARKTAGSTLDKVPSRIVPHLGNDRKSWADRSNASNRRSQRFGGYESDSASRSRDHHHRRHKHQRRSDSPQHQILDRLNTLNPILGKEKDMEAQRAARDQLADALFAGVNDELEDLTPDQRDALVQRAFQHSALRARRPVIWIPRDDLGVSDDEVHSMARFSQNLWVSNVRQGLDSKGRCVYSGAPPDFSEVDLIQL